MKHISDDITIEIMRALDEGSPPEMLTERFPEHVSLIREIAEVQNTLGRVAHEIPHPVTNNLHNRLLETESTVESPFFINSLVLNMNYKILVPVLVLGLIAVGGVTFLKEKNTDSNPQQRTPVAQNAVENTQTQTAPEDAATNDPTDQMEAPQKAAPEKTTVAQNASVDDVLAALSKDDASEQDAYADDGVNSDTFAQSDLSDLESDSYDY